MLGNVSAVRTVGRVVVQTIALNGISINIPLHGESKIAIVFKFRL